MTRRYELDESPHAGDLELVGMLPAELRRLALEFKALDVALGSKRIRHIGGSQGPTDPVSGEALDRRQEELRKLRESTRKAIGRLADDLAVKVRQVKRCPVCKAENSWDDAWCGESFIPPERGCGHLFVKGDSRTRSENG